MTDPSSDNAPEATYDDDSHPFEPATAPIAQPSQPPPVPPRPTPQVDPRKQLIEEVEIGAQQDVTEVINNVLFQSQCAIRPSGLHLMVSRSTRSKSMLVFIRLLDIQLIISAACSTDGPNLISLLRKMSALGKNGGAISKSTLQPDPVIYTRQLMAHSMSRRSILTTP